MNRLAVVIISGVALLVLLAFGWDSVRSLRTLQHELALADAEVKQQEERLLLALSPLPPNDDLARLKRNYEEATDKESRRRAFQSLAELATRLSATAEPRSVGYEITGALNRRVIAERRHQELVVDLDEFSQSTSGKVATFFTGKK